MTPGNSSRISVILLGALLLLVPLITGCGMTGDPLLPETTVVSLAGEDMADSCRYALRVTPGPVLVPGQPPSEITQTGVLVVFERADTLTLFDDPNVIAAAQQLHMAMLYAYQCDAKTFHDLQPNAAAGPGRALFQALNQFAVSQSHPELATANVFLTGFSASAALSVTTAIEYPSRVLGIIPYAPGSNALNVSMITVTPELARIPALFLVSAQDGSAGDQLPFFLYENGWFQGAPWTFAVQHATGHCCVDSISPILIPWMTAIFKSYTTPNAAGQVALANHGISITPTLAFQVATDGVFDPVGWQDFYIGSYSMWPNTIGGPFQTWLPDKATTDEWITWVTNPNGNEPSTSSIVP